MVTHIVSVCAVVAMVLAPNGAHAQHADPIARLADPRYERAQKIVVIPFEIYVDPFEGAPERPDRSAILRSLSDAATQQAVRVLTARHISVSIERRESPAAASRNVEDVWTLTGTVSLPISLPARIYGLDAGARRGVFARAEATLRNAQGAVIRRSETVLVWGDARWTRGGPRRRRNRPLDSVLVDFAKKAADRVVDSVVREQKKGS